MVVKYTYGGSIADGTLSWSQGGARRAGEVGAGAEEVEGGTAWEVLALDSYTKDGNPTNKVLLWGW